MPRKTFGFKDSYEVDEQLKRGGWRAASMMASDEPSEGEQRRARRASSQPESAESLEAAAHLEAAEEYAQTLSNVQWSSVDKVVKRVLALRDEVLQLAEKAEAAAEPTEGPGGGLLFETVQGPLVIEDGPDTSTGKKLKVYTLTKDADSTKVVVKVSSADRTVKEQLADGSSIALSHQDNILTESFNDGCVSRLDRKQFLKTIQLAPSDGNILIQAVLHGPRKGHLTIQCMDGTVVIIDEEGGRSQRQASPRSRRRSSMGLRSPNARPPNKPPPPSPSGSRSPGGRRRGSSGFTAVGADGGDGNGTPDNNNRPRARTASTDLNASGASNALERRQSRGSLFRQLTAEKLVVPARQDEEQQPNLPVAGGPGAGAEGKIQWRCIRKLWIHSKPATLSHLVRHMEIGETIVQVRRIEKTVGRTWIEFIDHKDPKNKKARYVATMSKLGLKTMIPIFNS
eukprot:INCI776.1.p1 GENE.INCI776.1~~INCI776.1.p1  ORF type:complete len:455 (+),score=91.47 INCI776.1:69-1433(+)